MMGVETPETCWATHKSQVINLWNCCIWLVDLSELYDDARTCQRQKASGCLQKLPRFQISGSKSFSGGDSFSGNHAVCPQGARKCLQDQVSAQYTARPIYRPIHSHIGIRYLGIRIHTGVSKIEQILCLTTPSNVFARSEVLTYVLLKILVLWEITPRRLLNHYRHFEGS